jgi:GTPase involved in cell partitioning and DNA repair
VLSGEKQRVARGYDFSKVCRWFAERSDLILLMFDCSKLDISDEFKSVIEELQPYEDRVHCVLNKADQLDQEKLMRGWCLLHRFFTLSCLVLLINIRLNAHDHYGDSLNWL